MAESENADALHTEAVNVLRRVDALYDEAANVRALQLLHAALATGELAPVEESRAWANVGAANLLDFQFSGDPRALARATWARTEALRLTVEGAPAYPQRLSALGVLRRLEFEQSGRFEDLAAAIDLSRKAVAAAGADHPRRASLLSNLSSTLRVSYERGGTPNELDEAVILERQALDETAADDFARGGRLSDLSITLRDRFLLSGHERDLEDAVVAAQEAVDLSAGHKGGFAWLGNLGMILRSRYVRHGDVHDIDMAITCFRRALETTVSLGRGWRRSNLAAALITRFEAVHKRGDLDEAIEQARLAVAEPARDSVDDARRFNDLGYALATRAYLERSIADADEAVVAASRAASSVTEPDANFAMYHVNLGIAHRIRYRVTDDAAAAEAAIQAWRVAANSSTSIMRERVDASLRWGEFASWVSPGSEAALAGYSAGVALLPRLAWRGLNRQSRERLLSSVADLSGGAVAAAISARRPELALEFAELARGVLWTQMLNTRTDLQLLARRAPGLAERVGRIRSELDP